MASKRSYSSHKYILLELVLNFLASVLKENVWIRNSSSSVDTATKTYLYKKPPKLIMQECIFYKIHVDPMDFAFRKAKKLLFV